MPLLPLPIRRLLASPVQKLGAQPLERKMGGALVVATLVLVAVLGITYVSAVRLLDVAAETRHSEDLLNDLRRLQAYAYDVETGSRGYVISGDERQLAPYYSGRGLLESLRQDLRKRVAGNPHMAGLFDGLEPLLDERVAFANQLVALRRNEGFDPAQDLLRTNQGQDLTDDIRARLDQMQAYAGLRLEQNRRAEESSSRWVFYSSAAAALITVALFGGAFIAVRKELALRSRTEKALRQSQADVHEARARLAGIIDSANDAILTIDQAGNVVMFNRAAEKLLGISARDAIGRSALRFIPERYRAAFEDDARNPAHLVARGIIPAAENACILRADGTEIAVEARTSVLDVGGKELFTIVIRDVSERRAAEEALRRSEANYRAVVDGSSDAIFALDIDPGGVPSWSFANATYERIYGVAAEARLGKSIKEVDSRSDAAFMAARAAEVIAAGRPVHYERTFELNGEVRTVSVNLTPLYDDEGRCYRIIGSSRDITEQRRSQHLDAEARHARSLGVLASGIAHDFNNVLTAISGNAGLAAILTGDDSPVREPVREIEAAVRRAGDLVAQLLTYSGQTESHIEQVDVCSLVDSVVARLRPTIASPIMVNHDCQPGLAPVEADPIQLRQAIGNIILNAAEAIGDASGLISVTSGVRFADRAYLAGASGANDMPEGEYVYIDIKDTGPGMDPTTVVHAFDPFFTTKFAGRGLGLPAALGIVRSHGGALRIDSVPGRGTLIALLFPCARNGPPAADHPPHASGTARQAPPSRRAAQHRR